MVIEVTNGEVRRARRVAEVTQQELSDELGISRASYSYFERFHAPLPRGITPSDAIDAINRIVARRNAEQAS